MITRICVRAPVMLITALIMAFSIHASLSMIFVAAIVILAATLSFIIFKATGTFNRVFKKYDDLNASVQENVGAIRVVKAFVREDYERSKFNKAANAVYRMFVKAETYVCLLYTSCMHSLLPVWMKRTACFCRESGRRTRLFSAACACRC